VRYDADGKWDSSFSEVGKPMQIENFWHPDFWQRPVLLQRDDRVLAISNQFTGAGYKEDVVMYVFPEKGKAFRMTVAEDAGIGLCPLAMADSEHALTEVCGSDSPEVGGPDYSYPGTAYHLDF